jgi:transposase InsO family protein
VNAKQVQHLNVGEELISLMRKRNKRVQQQRLPQGQAVRRNENRNMAFDAQRLPDHRWIRVLTVFDQYTRGCLTLHAHAALSGEEVAAALDNVVVLRRAPRPITVDNGTVSTSKPMDLWACHNGVDDGLHLARTARGERLLRELQLEAAG